MKIQTIVTEQREASLKNQKSPSTTPDWFSFGDVAKGFAAFAAKMREEQLKSGDRGSNKIEVWATEDSVTFPFPSDSYVYSKTIRLRNIDGHPIIEVKTVFNASNETLTDFSLDKGIRITNEAAVIDPSLLEGRFPIFGIKYSQGEPVFVLTKQAFDNYMGATIEGFKFEREDAALIAQNPGGIDLDASKMALTEAGDKAEMAIDNAMMARFKGGDFSGVTPVIIRVAPLSDVSVLLGLN